VTYHQHVLLITIFCFSALWTFYFNDSSPSINGFSVGTDLSNTEAYIGRATSSGNLNHPGRLQIESKKIYYTFGTAEAVGITKNDYLVLPERCSCRFEPANIAKNLEGYIFFGYGIGVHYWSSGKVSVVKTSVTENKEWYPSETGGAIKNATVNNSMVCTSTIASNVKPTVKSANGNCAFWRAYKFNDDPVGNGFFAGMSYNNKSAYVGRGWVSDEMVPGRVQVAATAGVYAEFWNQDKFLTYPEYLVVPENCKCEWVRALDALTRVGLVITNDQTRDAGTLVGLVQLPNGQIAIAKATRQWNDMFYMNEFGKTVFNAPTTRVLVCEDASFQAKTTTVAPKITTSPTACREFE
jgi:hypothetical protein